MGSNERHTKCNMRNCIVFILILILAVSFFGGFAAAMNFLICIDSTSTFCICHRYSHKSHGIYDCILVYNHTNKAVQCLMDTGYFLCTIKTRGCNLNNGGYLGWTNCTYYDSDKNNHPINTCSIHGTYRCYVDNKTCCYYN